MDSPDARVILSLLGAVVVVAALVYLFGYPALIWIAVLSSFAALALIVVLSAGDLGDRSARRG